MTSRRLILVAVAGIAGYYLDRLLGFTGWIGAAAGAVVFYVLTKSTQFDS